MLIQAFVVWAIAGGIIGWGDGFFRQHRSFSDRVANIALGMLTAIPSGWFFTLLKLEEPNTFPYVSVFVAAFAPMLFFAICGAMLNNQDNHQDDKEAKK